MRPIVFTNPASRIFFAAAVASIAVVQLRTGIRSTASRFSGDPDVQHVDRGSLVAVGIFGAVGIIGGVEAGTRLPYARIAPGQPLLHWPVIAIGILLIALGAALRQWAMSTLGRFFTYDVRISPGQTVVDRGPYRVVRHPSYSALLLLFAGLGLASDNWLALPLFVVLPTIGLVWRIRVEEAALTNAFGDAYHRYAESRKRLVPGLW